MSEFVDAQFIHYRKQLIQEFLNSTNLILEIKKIMKINLFLHSTVFSLYLISICSGLANLKKQVAPEHIDIVLVGTNDIHGTAYPAILARRDTGETYKYGGLVYMARIIEIIKKENPGRMLYLDAGDYYQGGIEASKKVSSGEIISDYFNHLKLQGGAIGNHQFDFGPEFLSNYLDWLKNDIIDANLIDSKTQQLPLKNQKPSQMYTFPIKKKSISQNLTEIKIGVIGLSTIQTPYTTSGFIDGLFPDSYKFQKYKQKVIDQSKILKDQGAHAVIIVSHVGNECNRDSNYGFWTMKNQPKQIPCDMNDEIYRLLDKLPKGMIDAVVQGHRHTQSHYFYKGVPIIGTINGGYYLNTLRLRFTVDGTKVSLNHQQLVIQGPIPVCERIFEGTRRCEYVGAGDLQKAGQLIQWQFHGQKVYADPQLSLIYNQKYSQKMKPYEYQIVKNFIQTPLIKDFPPNPNSAIGNLITNVFQKSINRRGDLQFDFVLLNAGMFRSEWHPGVIRYMELYSMLPFDNHVSSFKVSGRDLKKILEILQNGAKRYYPTWGLQQKYLINLSDGIQFSQTRHKHFASIQKTESNKVQLQLEQLRSTVTGDLINDDEIYTGVTIDFLVNGGDDFAQIINKPDEIKILQKEIYPLLFKDLIQQQLYLMEELTEDDLIGPNGMERIILENTDPKK